MKGWRGELTRMIVLVGCLAGTDAKAVPTLNLSWQLCMDRPTQSVIGGAGGPTAWIWVTGQDVAHKGYEFRIALADAGGNVPDAWRFDAAGCQGSDQITIGHILAVDSNCGPFQGALASSQVRSVSWALPGEGAPSSALVVRLANSYPAGNTTQVNPLVRYYLGGVNFDHTFSVNGPTNDPGSCGDVDRGMCLALLPAFTTYTRLDGTLVPFAIGNGTITANGGACGAVPLLPSTWGQVKRAYRR